MFYCPRYYSFNESSIVLMFVFDRLKVITNFEEIRTHYGPGMIGLGTLLSVLGILRESKSLGIVIIKAP